MLSNCVEVEGKMNIYGVFGYKYVSVTGYIIILCPDNKLRMLP